MDDERIGKHGNGKQTWGAQATGTKTAGNGAGNGAENARGKKRVIRETPKSSGKRPAGPYKELFETMESMTMMTGSMTMTTELMTMELMTE